MLIIHISDIHFRHSETQSFFDPNAGLRADLLDDLEERLQSKGSPQPAVIVVSGDIAFAGKKDEYAFAKEWFETLCNRCNIGFERIFLVPGNHDVDRSIATGPILSSLHQTVGATDQNQINSKLVNFLEDDTAGQALHSSIAAYNDFSVGLGCSFSAPASTTISRELNFSDGSQLNIWGFNSSLFCGGELDQRSALVIDPGFQRMRKAAGVVNLAVHHHPTSWLRNDADFRAHLNQHAQIHLSGHEHSNAVDITRDNVRLSASAVHPERGSEQYEPGYNLIEIDVQNVDGERQLSIEVEVREYQNRPARFRPKLDIDGNNFRATISLPFWQPAADVNTSEIEEMHNNDNVLSSDPMISFRELSLEFLSMPMSERYRIAELLGLISPDDQAQPDFERTRRMLLKVKENNKVDALSRAIEQVKSQNTGD